MGRRREEGSGWEHGEWTGRGDRVGHGGGRGWEGEERRREADGNMGSGQNSIVLKYSLHPQLL